VRAADAQRYMPTRLERSLKILGNILIAASSLFFVETGFEMYVLTLLQGQQMLFFSLAHIAPGAIVLVAFSGVAFVCLAVFALVMQMLRFMGKLDSNYGYSKFMLIVLCIQVIHVSLLFTYDRWSALFS
jgi:TRAP-type C4-dicarboxylate transport system permease small subunit